MARKRVRENGDGSIYKCRNGWAAYAWVTTPAGRKTRKYVYAKERDDCHDKWIALQDAARKGPVVTSHPTVGGYLDQWLAENVEPTLRQKSGETYAMHVRLHIAPWLGTKKLNKLTVREVRTWLNKLANTCQCCAQGKDTSRPEAKRKCCAVGRCCDERFSRRSLQNIRDTLRTALNCAIADELIDKNPAAHVKIPKARRAKKVKPWTVEEARRFLECAGNDRDPLYAAYVLILVLGLRRGEVLGLAWPNVRLGSGELYVTQGLQRVNRRLVLGEVKTEASEAPLPLPDICMTALRERQKLQAEHEEKAGEVWQSAHELVFTTRYGTPIEPRNFVRSFKARCAKAGVPAIRVHDTRHTCGSLLAALGVHPRVAMQILRHSKITVTMEIYTHVPSEDTQRALKQLGESLGGAAGEDPE